MKRPKCMEKPLDWKVSVKNICPKCGSETETDDEIHYQCTNLSCINAWFPFTYEEKVKT
jgi:NADH pyrophosphatase NudC (nudix superfamily)